MVAARIQGQLWAPMQKETCRCHVRGKKTILEEEQNFGGCSIDCFVECEAEDAAPAGTSMAKFGEIRIGWKVGWREEASKERCCGVVIEMWHCFEEREEEDAKVLEWESDEMQQCFEECEAENAAPAGTSIVGFGETVGCRLARGMRRCWRVCGKVASS